MSREVFDKRLEKLRVQIRKHKLDGVFITRRENYMYFSGFTGTSAFLVITENDAVLITDFRYTQQAGNQAPSFEVIEYKGSLVIALNEVLKSRDVGRLGFEDTHMTVDKYNEYKNKLTVREMASVGGWVDEIRQVKDSTEIKVMKRAMKIADDTFAHILKYLKPGVAEIEIAAEMEHFMRRQGASGPSFDTIVASGKRSSMPHGVASEKRLEMGDAVTLDYGALYNGYCSDITRTVFLGQPDPVLKKIYGIVLEAQELAIAGAKKGMVGKEVDLIARDHIAKAGYGDYFGHGLGHGVGLEIHEEPRFSPSGNIKMKNGMVITVEPGIYLPGVGGVRIEDVVVIRNDKPLNLTGAPKDLMVL